MKRKADQISGSPTGQGASKPLAATQGSSGAFIKSFSCPFAGCDKVYNRTSKLDDHVRSHTGDRPFYCTEPTCAKRFLRKSHLQAHTRTHLPREERPYLCEEDDCGKRFSTNQHLRQHVALHSMPTPYQCTYCSTSFHKNTQLKRHVADVHLHTKPCPCPQLGCKMSFAYQSILDKHVARVHDDTKRYSCEIDNCTETFTKWSHLQAHLKEMHKMRCKYCNKAYSDKSALRLHLETHEIPLAQRTRFECSQCDKKFTKAYSLKRHISFVHEGERAFQCDSCLKAFAHKKTLLRHVERQHGDAAPVQETRSTKRIKEGGLLDMLTGAGYSDSGRHIQCTEHGCAYRFTREYDLDRHLDAMHPETFMDQVLRNNAILNRMQVDAV